MIGPTGKTHVPCWLQIANTLQVGSRATAHQSPNVRFWRQGKTARCPSLRYSTETCDHLQDRRPITPPPCIRLIVLDNKTGEEIDPNDVDSTFFVLMVDLWHEDSSRAVNLVRHSSAAPTVSISSSTVASYPPPPERTMYLATAMMPPQWDPATGRQVAPPAHYPQQGMPQQYNYQANPNNPAYSSYGSQNGYAPNQQPIPLSIPAPTLNQNHTRNLIGMNAVNACRLNDPEGKLGFWFVLQDLSVRTEGNFRYVNHALHIYQTCANVPRLKLSMCDVGSGQGANAVVSNGKCPVLATSFSEPFTVYSAKKFPGVIESTPLSKCFAGQGIKIPIRKDGPKVANQDEFDADEYGRH